MKERKKKTKSGKESLKNLKFFTWLKGLHIDPSVGVGVDEVKARMST